MVYVLCFFMPFSPLCSDSWSDLTATGHAFCCIVGHEIDTLPVVLFFFGGLWLLCKTFMESAEEKGWKPL